MVVTFRSLCHRFESGRTPIDFSIWNIFYLRYTYQYSKPHTSSLKVRRHVSSPRMEPPFTRWFKSTSDKSGSRVVAFILLGRVILRNSKYLQKQHCISCGASYGYLSCFGWTIKLYLFQNSRVYSWVNVSKLNIIWKIFHEPLTTLPGSDKTIP